MAVSACGPVVVEPRAILVPSRASDAGELVDAIDASLEELRSDGTLTELSEQRFGGKDVTAAPR